MYKKIKIVLYTAAKYCGLFSLSSLLTAGKMRILCYHGISSDDEHVWNPGLFIAPAVLKRRFSILKRTGHPVLSLSDAVRKLESGALPRHATVITFDDGFQDNYALGLPIFKEFGFPVTIYVSSYYVEKQTPVFRLALQYLFWKSGVERLDLSELYPQLAEADLWTIIDFAETRLSDPERLALFRRIAGKLSIDPERIEKTKLLHFMTADEIRELDRNGVDVELHTHRHPLLKSSEQASREITDNKRVLEGILGRRLKHFCYPSGQWSDALRPALEEQGILSATTCDPGLNTRRTHRYALKRYLDGADKSEIEFEAELSGFADILRGIVRTKA